MEKELNVYLNLKFPSEGNVFEFLQNLKIFLESNIDLAEIYFDFSSITRSDYWSK